MVFYPFIIYFAHVILSLFLKITHMYLGKLMSKCFSCFIWRRPLSGQVYDKQIPDHFPMFSSSHPPPSHIDRSLIPKIFKVSIYDKLGDPQMTKKGNNIAVPQYHLCEHKMLVKLRLIFSHFDLTFVMNITLEVAFNWDYWDTPRAQKKS